MKTPGKLVIAIMGVGLIGYVNYHLYSTGKYVQVALRHTKDLFKDRHWHRHIVRENFEVKKKELVERVAPFREIVTRQREQEKGEHHLYIPQTKIKILEVVAEYNYREGPHDKKVLIVKTDFQSPYVRVESIIDKNGIESSILYVADHLMVRINDLESFKAYAKKYELRVVKELGKTGNFLVRIPHHQLEKYEEFQKIINSSQDAFFAEGDEIITISQTKNKISSTPNDKFYSKLWGMQNIGAAKTWDLQTDGPGPIVAIIDTGIDYNHEDLKDNIYLNTKEIPNNNRDDDNNGIVDDYYGANFIADKGNGLDDNDHGTHCAGIIGAIGNNTRGVAGVARKAKILPVKVFNAHGSGRTSDVVKGIEYARHMGAKIINNSWGGKATSRALIGAIDYAKYKDIIVVSASGNESSSRKVYPAAYDNDNIVSVLAIDRHNRLASFSNYGAPHVDIGAPGVNIYSTVIGGNRYQNMSGTSMATAHVTGVLTVLYNRFPNISYKQMIDLIYQSAVENQNITNMLVTGANINIYNAIMEGDKLYGEAVTPQLSANNRPVARGASYELDHNKSVSGQLNARDKDGDSLSYKITSQAISGDVRLSGNNFTYTPHKNFSGSDIFTFSAHDGKVVSDLATISIIVKKFAEPSVNSAPKANDLILKVNQDQKLGFVLKGEDKEGDGLTYSIVSHASNGILSISSDQVIYTPRPGFIGKDKIEYKVNDGKLDSLVGTIHIDVQAISANVAPIAEGNSAQVEEGKTAIINLKAKDDNGDQLIYSITKVPAAGILKLKDNKVIYTAKDGYTGEDRFSFKANDGNFDSNEAEILVRISGRPAYNTAPIVSDIMLRGLTSSDIHGKLKGSDQDGDSLTYEIVMTAKNGKARIESDEILFRSDANFSGKEQLSYRAFDGKDYSTTAKIIIDVKKKVIGGSQKMFMAGANGEVTIEAESYSSIDTKGVMTNWVSQKQTSVPSSEDTVLMQALPDAGLYYKTDQNFLSGSSMSYYFKVEKSGDYYLAFRGVGNSKNGQNYRESNSINYHLVEEGATGRAYFDSTLGWRSASNIKGRHRPAFSLKQGGVYRLDIHVREDGVLLDRFVITPNKSKRIKGTGPQESQYFTQGVSFKSPR